MKKTCENKIVSKNTMFCSTFLVSYIACNFKTAHATIYKT